MRGRLDEHASLTEVAEVVEIVVRENPETSILIAAGAIVTIIGLFVLIRWLRRPMGVRLRQALEKPQDVAVLMHPNPDPDAMACAIGIAHIAESNGTPATLYYSGQIRHQENRAFRTILDLEMTLVEDASELVEEAVVLVDHNTPRGFNGAETIEPYGVVDHHPGTASGIGFTDVRSEYGACASIIAEYFDELDAVVPPVNIDGVRGNGGLNDAKTEFVLTTGIATGLLYGIQADTAHLTKGCTAAEFEACSYLYPAADEDLLDRIANPQVSSEVLDVKARAISGRDVRGSFAISDVGQISDVDAIPQAADELLRLEGVTAVIVYGQRNGTIHVSGRSRDDRVHMGRTLETALDPVPMGSAGGHARMGGGQVPIEYLAGIGPSGAAQHDVVNDLHEQLFGALTGDV